MEWLEQIADCFVWLIPVVAVVGLVFLRVGGEFGGGPLVVPVYIAAMLFVSIGAIRTISRLDDCWFVHCGSLALMVVGGIYPSSAGDLADDGAGDEGLETTDGVPSIRLPS